MGDEITGHVQMATNVMLFTEASGRQFILASADTAFIFFCLRGEARLKVQGQIVCDYLVPAAPYTHDVGGADDAAIAAHMADDDVDSGGDAGAMAALAAVAVAAVTAVLGDDTGAGASAAVPLQSRSTLSGDGRSMDQRGADAVVATGDAALDGSNLGHASSTRPRRRGTSPPSRGDASTYAVPTDASAAEPSGVGAAAAAAPAGAEASVAPSVVVSVPSHNPHAIPMKRVEGMLMWNAFMVFAENLNVEGGMLDAIRTGRLILPVQKEDITQAVDVWACSYGTRLSEMSAATDLLLTTLRGNRRSLADKQVQAEIVRLLDAVDMCQRRLILPPPGGGDT